MPARQCPPTATHPRWFQPSGMIGSTMADDASLIQGQGNRATNARSGQPGGDRPVIAGLESIEHDTAVEARPIRSDEPRVAQEAKLAADRRSTRPQLCREARWPARAERQRGDDPTPGRVGEQLDPGTISLGHVAKEHDRSRCTRDHSGLIRDFLAGAGATRAAPADRFAWLEPSRRRPAGRRVPAGRTRASRATPRRPGDSARREPPRCEIRARGTTCDGTDALDR